MRNWTHGRLAASAVLGLALTIAGSGAALAAHFATTISQPAEGATLTANPIHVAGTTLPNALVTIYENGDGIAGDLSGSSGAWSVDVPLNRGTHTIEACAYDFESSELACSAPRTFTLDLPQPPPPTPTISAPAEGAVILTGTVAFSGTAQPSAAVRIFEDNALRGSTTANAGGSWSKSVAFPDGAHAVFAIAYDQYGQSSDPTAPRSFTVDAPPAEPAITSPTQGSYLASTEVTVAGTAEPAVLVKVKNRDTGMVLGQTTADGAGNWSVDLELAEGTHRITSTATDARGRESGKSATRTFSVDVTAPAVTIANGDPYVAVPYLALHGGATDALGVAEIDVTYARQGFAPVTATAECAGCPGTSVTWSSSPTLTPGVYEATAVAYDRAGNPSAPASRTVVVVLG